MSLYFDLVINCDLKADTPDDAIDAIACLISYEISEKDLSPEPQLLIDGNNIWNMIDDYELLAPEPKLNIISNFQPREFSIGDDPHPKFTQYRLQYCAANIKDDIFHPNYLLFIHWLVTVSNDRYLGYYKETNELSRMSIFHHLIVKDGKLQA